MYGEIEINYELSTASKSVELAAIKKRGAGVRGMNRSAADAYHINNPHEINKNIFRNRLGDNKMRQEAVYESRVYPVRMPLPRSYYPRYEAVRIKYIINKSRQQKLELQNKLKQAMSKVYSQRILEYYKYKQRLYARRECRRQQLVAKHLSCSSEYQSRIKSLYRMSRNGQINDKKHIEYAHVRYLKREQMLKEYEYYRAKQMLKEISARLKTDLTEIRVAAKKSWDLSKREFVSRAKTFESKRKSEPDKQYYLNYFSRVLYEEEKRRLSFERENYAYRKGYHKRIKEYRDYIHDKFVPVATEKSIFKPKQSLVSKQRTTEKRVRAGNEFLYQAKAARNKKLSKLDIERSFQQLSAISKTPKYKDYLGYLKANSKHIMYNPYYQLDKLMNKYVVLTLKEATCAQQLTEITERKLKNHMKNMQQSDYRIAKHKLRLLYSLTRTLGEYS